MDWKSCFSKCNLLQHWVYKIFEWVGYRFESLEDMEFKDTAAHEVGHEILKSYGGVDYSYGHKGTAYVATQKIKSNAPEFPIEIVDEIDLMKYFNKNSLGGAFYQPEYYKRRVIALEEALNLIWLTKMKIE